MLLRKRTVVVLDDSSDYSDEEDEADEEDEDEEEEDVVKEEEADLRDGGEQDDAAGDGDDDEEGDQRSSVTKKARISISLKGAKVCKVCKAKDHQAGFVGSVYMDCPNKPCYLCKKPGHTTLTCPHRIATEHGVVAALHKHSMGLVDFVHERQLRHHLPPVKLTPVIPNGVDSAVIRLHSRRVTYLEFHPTKDNLLISGDKKGQIGIWDFEKVFEKTVYDQIHTCLVNSIKFHPWQDGMLYTASSDGKVCYTDLETAVPVEIFDLNPDGWAGPSTWRMMYAMDLNAIRNLALAADNFGFLYQLDMRSNLKVGKPIGVHKKGTKVVGLHCHPIEPDLFLTCGNDHTARIWDMRMLDSDSCLAELQHSRVVTSAYFSPVTGTKILTTCQDNRIRVWDNICADLTTCSREIVHSHDFNRYLTSFKAEWDPKDPSECLTVIGRYISDDFQGVALHPIDFIDISTGQLVEQVFDHSITTICPVNKLHPRINVMATGSSRSLFIWKPKEESDVEANGTESQQKKQIKLRIYEADGGKSGKGKSKHDYGDDDDDDFSSCKKKVSNGEGPSSSKVARPRRRC
ncbi:unnamed protein product [Sphagnum balticum]